MIRQVYKRFTYLLLPCLLTQACEIHPPQTEALTDSLSASHSLQLDIISLKGDVRKLELPRADLLAALEGGVAPFSADGRTTDDPASLLTAKSSELTTAQGELRRVTRAGGTLSLVGDKKRLERTGSTLKLYDVGGSASLTLPASLSPRQLDALVGGLAHAWFTDAVEEPDAQASWGAIIVLLLIVIGATVAGGAAGQSCCESARSLCAEECSFSCTPLGGGSFSVSADGVAISTPEFCDHDCTCGDFGPPRQTEQL